MWESDNSLSLEEALRELSKEGNLFIDFIRGVYPCKQFHLTLVMQTSVELSRKAQVIVERADTLNETEEIGYNFTIARPDGNKTLMRLWRKQWCEIILRRCRLSGLQRVRVLYKLFQQNISLMFKNEIVRRLFD
jgi:hypothetical protein